MSEDHAALLATLDIFEDTPRELLEAMASDVRELRADAGEVLWQEGDAQHHFNVLVEGRIQYSRVIDGERVVLHHHDAVTYMGAIAALTENEVMITATAVQDVRLLRFPAGAFREVALHDPGVLRRSVRLTSEISRTNTALMQERERLASLGTLAAGLAHEIGNPAAAARSTAGELRRALAPYLAQAAGTPSAPPGEDPLDAADREDALGVWLADRDVESAWALASELAEAGFDEAWAAETGGEQRGAALVHALHKAAGGAQARALLDALDEALRRITTLVSAIREYSQVDRAPEADVDVHDGLEATLTILGHRLKATGTTVRREYDRTLPRISAFPSELNQVWTNLLGNAMEAAPGGTIVVRTARADGGVLVEVVDEGPGVPEAVRERVFDPFFSTKQSGGGQGLGLEIARRIVNTRHGGELVLAPPVDGEGARFQVRLRAA